MLVIVWKHNVIFRTQKSIFTHHNQAISSPVTVKNHSISRVARSANKLAQIAQNYDRSPKNSVIIDLPKVGSDLYEFLSSVAVNKQKSAHCH